MSNTNNLPFPAICIVPVPAGPPRITSLQIVAGNNDGSIIFAANNLDRKRLVVCNHSAANPITFNLGVKAVISQQGLTLPPLLPAAGNGGNIWDSGAGYCPTDDVYIAGTVGQWVTVMEWR